MKKAQKTALTHVLHVLTHVLTPVLNEQPAEQRHRYVLGPQAFAKIRKPFHRTDTDDTRHRFIAR